MQASDHLSGMLSSRLPADVWHWLSDQFERVLKSSSERELHIALGMIPRRLGHAELCPSVDELAVCNRIRPGWDPVHWSIADAARIQLLCCLADRGPADFGELFTALSRTADLSESLALYQGTVVFPVSKALDRQVSEGLRTNMRAVFEALAHRNPYAREHFDEHRWNHLVLKALFIDSALAPIQGLDERANAALARTLCDYAHERWAAGRDVSPELWRCVGPFATGAMLDDLRRVSESEACRSRSAAALALSVCADPAAPGILARMPEEVACMADGSLSWAALEAA